MSQLLANIYDQGSIKTLKYIEYTWPIAAFWNNFSTSWTMFEAPENILHVFPKTTIQLYNKFWRPIGHCSAHSNSDFMLMN